MTELPGEVEHLGGSLDALRAEHDELRRRVAVSDEAIALLQVEAAKNKRKWNREPSVLVATLALVVSVGTFVVGQVNLITDRRIEDRNQLSTLTDQLPTAIAQNQEKPNSAANDLLLLLANNAAALIDKLGPEASTAPEKLEVVGALVASGNLRAAKRLATMAEEQSTDESATAAADRIIADVDFQIGEVAAGRDMLRRIINLLQKPQNELDSPLLRDLGTFNTEVFWAGDEFSFAKSCPDATEQLKNAKQALDRLPPDRTVSQKTYLGNMTNIVTAGCPTAARTTR